MKGVIHRSRSVEIIIPSTRVTRLDCLKKKKKERESTKWNGKKKKKNRWFRAREKLKTLVFTQIGFFIIFGSRRTKPGGCFNTIELDLVGNKVATAVPDSDYLLQRKGICKRALLVVSNLHMDAEGLKERKKNTTSVSKTLLAVEWFTMYVQKNIFFFFTLIICICMYGCIHFLIPPWLCSITYLWAIPLGSPCWIIFKSGGGF